MIFAWSCGGLASTTFTCLFEKRMGCIQWNGRNSMRMGCIQWEWGVFKENRVHSMRMGRFTFFHKEARSGVGEDPVAVVVSVRPQGSLPQHHLGQNDSLLTTTQSKHEPYLVYKTSKSKKKNLSIYLTQFCHGWLLVCQIIWSEFR